MWFRMHPWVFPIIIGGIGVLYFDHEVFDWEDEEYIGEDGDIAGAVMFPDFESFIKLYFYGAFDNAYMAQCDDWGENPEDKSNWVR